MPLSLAKPSGRPTPSLACYLALTEAERRHSACAARRAIGAPDVA
jgi:hypothetical protein